MDSGDIELNKTIDPSYPNEVNHKNCSGLQLEEHDFGDIKIIWCKDCGGLQISEYRIEGIFNRAIVPFKQPKDYQS